MGPKPKAMQSECRQFRIKPHRKQMRSTRIAHRPIAIAIAMPVIRVFLLPCFTARASSSSGIYLSRFSSRLRPRHLDIKDLVLDYLNYWSIYIVFILYIYVVYICMAFYGYFMRAIKLLRNLSY